MHSRITGRSIQSVAVGRSGHRRREHLVFDTRNDTTGSRFMTDIYFTPLSGGAGALSPNLRVTDVSSNEHDCSGQFPCVAINYGNQQGDYAGLVSFGGASHPIWTDSRKQLDAFPGCGTGLAMEEVFTATITQKR